MAREIYQKSRGKWENDESGNTPIIADNLNHIENGIYNNSVNIEELFQKIEDLENRVETLEPIKIVSWADGKDAEIAAMARALRSGRISTEDTGWKVGQERTVQLSAIESEALGNHVAQTQTLVILHKGGKLFENGRECSFVVGLKNVLANGATLEGFGMNEANTNDGGWDACRMRKGCNEDFIKMLPLDLRSAFAKFQNITADGSGDTAKTSIDLFALAAEKEILGFNSYANATAEFDLFQFDYYATSLNRRKQVEGGGFNTNWWTRSPSSEYNKNFVFVSNQGMVSGIGASSPYGISPYGCI